MAVGIWQRLDQAGRNSVPFSTTVAAMLVGMMPLQLPDYSFVAPPLTLMAIYYWAIYRPDLLKPYMAFGIGVLQDLLGGSPLGMSALVYVLSYWLVLTQRRYFLGNSFWFLWLGFALVAVGAGAVQWVAYSLMTVHLVAPGNVVAQALLAIVLFPVPAWCFSKLHRSLLS
ncbi:rod shape-determining protein MreD [Nitrospirillum sp. BR 11752]|uniref:Rod shape-determining protein MreD n=1 Tax=Nitrospirillum amazonense TaxID=28077 RepID=A0A560GPG6_9PROT|nr:rod shape-determining protein MreD [Nitrospirillum amazonense]MEE3625624.1 rod shape-determining protein MreD [Nitrospirillum sp. BR 11752]TWB35892.1 rod shape-determining protein MreD [Nitrospirillum amazonense]